MSDLLLTYYGDDFSGSTDVMEALTIEGVPTVLFLSPPTPDDLAQFPDCRAAGVAGISRSQSPAWMSENLNPIFRAMRQLGAPLFHYKVCSTFDSSPTVGNIGRAIEIGREVFETGTVPLVVGAPALRRYVAFGNLFAAAGSEIFRIDQHPTMSRHPITPMAEADLRLHLRQQTSLRVSRIGLLNIRRGTALADYRQARESGAPIVLFDTLDNSDLPAIGACVWESRQPQGSFVAGSSGIEYSLTAHWRSANMIPAAPVIPDAGEVDRLLVVSGSCSPGTAEQIAWAQAHGFQGVAIDARKLVEGADEQQRVVTDTLAGLQAGRSVVAYTAFGPDSPMKIEGGASFGNALGQRLGELASLLVQRSGVGRCVIAGGDTSGQASRALQIRALRMIRPMAPGSPLCRAWRGSGEPLEILLKGGQVGGPRLFGEVKSGRTDTHHTSMI